MLSTTETDSPYYDALVQFAQRSLGNREDALDTVQETFLRQKQSGKSLYGEHLRNSLFFIARNIIRDRIKRLEPENAAKQAYFQRQENRESSNPSQTAEDRDFFSVAEEFVRSLPARQREIFKLKFIEDFQTPEIALMANTTPENVRKILCDLMHSLRNRFQQ